MEGFIAQFKENMVSKENGKEKSGERTTGT